MIAWYFVSFKDVDDSVGDAEPGVIRSLGSYDHKPFSNIGMGLHFHADQTQGRLKTTMLGPNLAGCGLVISILIFGVGCVL